MSGAPSEKTVERLRARIDRVDRKLSQLLSTRLELSRRAIEAKRKLGLPALDRRREREILARLTKDLSPADARDLRRVYREIFRTAIGRR